MLEALFLDVWGVIHSEFKL
uniref:Uncharacterized protein n=1 Tax=Rhizophora mucronata TaxID=61149 RepID=A0A2P2IPQ8_RHIMU